MTLAPTASKTKRRFSGVAVAHTILVMVYQLLCNGTTYHELGGNNFDERDRQRAVRSAVSGIERLGYSVTLNAA